MLQRFFTVAVILACILWLAVSYIPALQALLPTIAFVGSSAWLAWLALIALVAFLSIQLWLVYSTVSAVRAFQKKGGTPSFQLKVGAELLWTALPIVITIVVAWASHDLWLNLVQQ